MASLPPGTMISAIVPTEQEMEHLIVELQENTGIGRHQISLQGTPFQISHSYGKAYMDPESIRHSVKPPTSEPFLQDDFGWLLGFTFAIPFIIGVILGVFFIGDLFSVADNFIYGTLGGLVGAIIGGSLAFLVKKHKENIAKKQENQGGFVIWVQVDSEEQIERVIPVFIKHHATRVEPEKGSWISDKSCFMEDKP